MRGLDRSSRINSEERDYKTPMRSLLREFSACVNRRTILMRAFRILAFNAVVAALSFTIMSALLNNRQANRRPLSPKEK